VLLFLGSENGFLARFVADCVETVEKWCDYKRCISKRVKLSTWAFKVQNLIINFSRNTNLAIWSMAINTLNRVSNHFLTNWACQKLFRILKKGLGEYRCHFKFLTILNSLI